LKFLSTPVALLRRRGAVDVSGFTAGDIALSLNNQGPLANCSGLVYDDLSMVKVIYRLIRDAGIRSEFLLHILEKRAGEPPDSFILKAEDATAAGSSIAFLSSRLRYTTDERGQEICLASLPGQEEVGVMMGWESGISEYNPYCIPKYLLMMRFKIP
jgi:type IV protein arginine methyltransferase